MINTCFLVKVILCVVKRDIRVSEFTKPVVHLILKLWGLATGQYLFSKPWKGFSAELAFLPCLIAIVDVACSFRFSEFVSV